MPLTLLHPSQLAGLGFLPKDTPVALLARHSIREEPTNSFAGYDVPLTQEGRDLARAYGVALPMPINAAYSSPVGRCVDTATLILEGAEASHAVTTAGALVEPGCFVETMENVAGLFLKLGPIGFANKHLKGEIRGILSPAQGVRKILKHIEESLIKTPLTGTSLAGASLKEGAGITLHITHDTILASFMYALLEVSTISKEDWPWMMEGVYLWFDGGDVHWVWRGEYGCAAWKR